MCVCTLLLPRDRDRWIGNHHIYQRNQFMKARQGKAGACLNLAFKSQPSICTEPSGSSWLQNRFVREDEPAGDKAAARGFMVQNQERWCCWSAGMQTNDPFCQSRSESRAFLRIIHLQFSKIRVWFPINALQQYRKQDYCHLFLWQQWFVKH